MTKKRKKLTMITGMVLGITIFAGAAYASYYTSNGYSVAKNAVKKLGENENYTASLNLRYSVDDVTYSNLTITQLYDRDGEVISNTKEKEDAPEYNSSYEKWIQDDTVITTMHYGENEASTIVEKNASAFLDLHGDFDKLCTDDANERKRIQKMINFIELLGDTMVGDLKNNVIYVSGDDDSSTYEINLDTIQIPEFVNAGLSVMFSDMNYTYSDPDVSSTAEPYLALGTEPTVDNVHIKFTVNSEGRFTALTGSVLMVGTNTDGTTHDMKIEGSLDMTDYGATQPQRVDISTLPNIQYEDMGDIYTVPTSDGGYEIELQSAE